MNQRSLAFGGITVDVPANWREISAEVDAPDPPFTLVDHFKDIGALQFSIALYESGRIPDPSPVDLLRMAEEMGEQHALLEPMIEQQISEGFESAPSATATTMDTSSASGTSLTAGTSQK